MTLRSKVVDLVGLHLLDDADQVGGIGQVAVVQDQAPAWLVRILVEVIDALGVEGGGTTLDAMDLVALFQQKFRQIGAVLTGDSRDQGSFCLCHVASPLPEPR
ncbi:hypothetical protein SDC9_195282 [bioreactor metagenome]|uniref:Uncharacterized protein n=1 Tax=bioreactor metagenome TaxID=1076179 RepID=A0A645I8U2_9ZZZZ